MPNNAISNLQLKFSSDFTLAALKTYVIGVCVVLIIVAFVSENKWVLAGIAAYITLP